MRLLLLTAVIACTSLIVHAQAKINRENEMEEGIPVFQGQMQIKSEGRSFSFAFAQGDRVLIKLSTEKDKNIRSAKLSFLNGSKIWEQDDVSNINEVIVIAREAVYTIEIIGKGLGGRGVNLDIIRKPGNQIDFNPAWMKYSTYTERNEEYTVDSVIGYKEPVISEKLIKIFDQFL